MEEGGDATCMSESAKNGSREEDGADQNMRRDCVPCRVVADILLPDMRDARVARDGPSGSHKLHWAGSWRSANQGGHPPRTQTDDGVTALRVTVKLTPVGCCELDGGHA
jgi:hypothetical protein